MQRGVGVAPGVTPGDGGLWSPHPWLGPPCLSELGPGVSSAPRRELPAKAQSRNRKAGVSPGAPQGPSLNPEPQESRRPGGLPRVAHGGPSRAPGAAPGPAEALPAPRRHFRPRGAGPGHFLLPAQLPAGHPVGGGCVAMPPCLPPAAPRLGHEAPAGRRSPRGAPSLTDTPPAPGSPGGPSPAWCEAVRSGARAGTAPRALGPAWGVGRPSDQPQELGPHSLS